MPINFEEMGDSNKKTIIFVHGAGGSSATWFMQLRGLSSDFHAVAVELNGHGKSSDRAEEDVLHSYLHDLHEVVTSHFWQVIVWAAHLHNFMRLTIQNILEE